MLHDAASVGVPANTQQLVQEEVSKGLAGASATKRKLAEACEVRLRQPGKRHGARAHMSA